MIPNLLSEWFRALRQRFFMAAVRVTAEEAATDLEAEAIDIKKRRLTQVLEALDLANQLPTDQDKHKEKALAFFREDILDVRKVTDQVLTGRMTFPEGSEALHALPPGVGNSPETYTAESKPVVRQALPDGKGAGSSKPAIPAEPDATPTQKRGRGRPRKYPRPEANGHGPLTESSSPGQEDGEA